MVARRRVSPTERREAHAAVDDPEIVLAAALRFLESRSRSVAEVRRRLSQAGYRAELIDGAIGRLSTSACSTTRRSGGRGSSPVTARGREASGRCARSWHSRASIGGS